MVDQNSALQTAVEKSLNPSIPEERGKKLLWVTDDMRDKGIHIAAGKGSGKSRMLGRFISWFDFIRGIPFVVFDPHGPTTDNFLDKVTRMPKEIQERLWPRVLYIDMSGKSGNIIPFPLYYRLGNEGLFEISQRYLDVVRKLDPFLQTASVQGWNPLWRTGTYTGMVLSGLGLQITEAEHLLKYPSSWKIQLSKLLDEHPEALPAVTFFRELANTRANMRDRKTEAFFNKIAMFLLDPTMQAMFGGKSPGIDWHQIIHNRMAVLLDFRHVLDIERRRFLMVWSFFYLLDFIKNRGAGRHRPIGLIIDELTSLFSVQSLTGDVMASELNELINVIARNYSVWLTIAHQEQYQLTEHMQNTLLTMGTQVFGVTSSRDTALSLARQYFPYDPYWVKKQEPIWLSWDGGPGIVDYRDVEFTVEEQQHINSEVFSRQGLFQFLIRSASNISRGLIPISIAGLDPNLYPNHSLVTRARELLMQRNGERVDAILEEIGNRLPVRGKRNLLSRSKRKNKAQAKNKPSIWNK